MTARLSGLVFTGVRQGCILSPILFTIFIDGLARVIKNSGLATKLGDIEVEQLLFADDIVLAADNPSDLQILLHIIDRYSKRYRFTFNIEKSNIVILVVGGTPS